MPDLTVDDYQVGWICALPKEMAAAQSMLDEEHPDIEGLDSGDANSYALGRIHRHNVVIACMPAGADGTVNAANVARDMARTFPALRIGLMVGIGGGIPHLPSIDIRLGDVVVSQPQGTLGGVIQYDKGKALTGGKFIVKGQLNQPPPVLLQALSRVQAEHDRRDSYVSKYMSEALEKNPKMKKTGYTRPKDEDCLFCPGCDQAIENSGSNHVETMVPQAERETAGIVRECSSQPHHRECRDESHPAIHYGIIASGNQVVKDAVVRDRLRYQFEALCVEMEAAGLMNHFPCLIIRGICDYADSHKNDTWHRYAAMTAAAYGKELLLYVSAVKVSESRSVQELVGVLGAIHNTGQNQLRINQQQLEVTQRQSQQSQTQYDDRRHQKCHQSFLPKSSYLDQKDINPERASGTCQWVLNHPQYIKWYENCEDDLLWISADPGCGKSVLAKFLVDEELRATSSNTTCYFFFKDNKEQDKVNVALCAILHQIFSQQPRQIECALPSWERYGDQLANERSELWKIIVAATMDSDHDVTFIFDALDECKEADRNWLIDKLSDFYVTEASPSAERRKSHLKFLVTSRPYGDIEGRFDHHLKRFPTIRLQGEFENDQIHLEIDEVIRIRVRKLAENLQMKSEVQERLQQDLLKMRNRTYLWLHLTMDVIETDYKDHLRPEQMSLPSLPTDVEDAYEKILSRARKSQHVMSKVLTVVLGAHRPLSVQEMAIALGIATSTKLTSLGEVRLEETRLPDNLRRWCGLFIFINHSKIYLIHQTAKEFLVRAKNIAAPLAGWKHFFEPCQVEKEMARICLELLFLDDIKPTAAKLNTIIRTWSSEYKTYDPTIHGNADESLIEYAAASWPRHFRDAEVATNDPVMEIAMKAYETESGPYVSGLPIEFFQQYRMVKRSETIMTSVNLASLRGHEVILASFLNAGGRAKINEMDVENLTALDYAAISGHFRAVEVLIDQGADVNLPNGNAFVGAADAQRWDIVWLLIRHGLDVNVDDGGILQVAAAHSCIEAVQSLLEHGADVNAGDGEALIQATLNEDLEIVEILVSRGAEVNARDGEALIQAVMRDLPEAVEILAKHGADVNTRDGEAFKQAVAYRCPKIIQFLVEQGANIGSSLADAARYGDTQVMELLCNLGAHIDAKDGLALRKASEDRWMNVETSHLEVIEVLTNRGADLRKYGGQALVSASYWGRLEVVKFLMDRGADVNAQAWNPEEFNGAQNSLQAVRRSTSRLDPVYWEGPSPPVEGTEAFFELRRLEEERFSSVEEFLIQAGAVE